MAEHEMETGLIHESRRGFYLSNVRILQIGMARHECQAVVRRRAGPVTCGGTFECARCHRIVGWCLGGHEGSRRDYWCVDCWAQDERSTPEGGEGNG